MSFGKDTNLVSMTIGMRVYYKPKNYPKAKYKAYLTKKEADKAFEEGFQNHLFKEKGCQ